MTAEPAANAVDAGSQEDEAALPSRPPHVMSPSWKFTQAVCRIVTTLAFDLKASGTEYMPPTGGVLIVSNHQSYLDPVLIAVKLKRPMSYMAKSELFKNPAFAKLIRELNAFPIHRGKGDKGAIEETVRRLKAGYLLNIFPEGTRTPDGQIQPMQRGVALVVRRANVPIVPAVLEGSFRSWSGGRKIPRAAFIRVAYGPPFDATGMKPDAIMQWMETTLRTMHAELCAKMRADGELR
jgi:1-acyl-sn-glycerol-3-phosphate acyltransferase